MNQYIFLLFFLIFSFKTKAQKNYEPIKIDSDRVIIQGKLLAVWTKL